MRINKELVLFDHSRISVLRFILYVSLGFASVLIPIVLWRAKLPNISSTYGAEYLIFEIFGFCASIALVVFAYLELRKHKGAALERFLPIILLLAVSFFYLIFIAEYSAKSWDYEALEGAAKALIEGENPYNGLYLYPPLGVQLFSWAYQFVETVASRIQTNASPAEIWYLVFYLYQCGQFFLIQIAFILCYYFARALRLKIVPASVLVTILLLWNNPLFRTLKFNQVNLYILVLFLTAILLLRRHPVLSGFAAALGGHIKLYPLILIFPWAATRKIAAIIGAVIGFLGILLIQTNVGRNWGLWSQFLAFASSPYEKVQFLTITYFRDNSLHSFIYNIFRTLAYIEGSDEPRFRLASAIYFMAALAVIIWFVLRFLSRERAYRVPVEKTEQNNDGLLRDTLRLFGHSMDAMALVLIISPIVWEHQYILAIPLVIWTLSLYGKGKYWQIGIAAFLMFGLPTFDIFPFSYHRIAGLMMLLHYNKPQSRQLKRSGNTLDMKQSTNMSN